MYLNQDSLTNNNSHLKRVFLRTYGCQMNEHDSERMLSHLKGIDFVETKNSDDAHLVLFNTCAIRDHANARFYSHLGEMKHLKEKNPEVVIGVGGCVGQSEGEILLSKYRHLDFVFSPDHIDYISEMVTKAFKSREGDAERFLWKNEMSLNKGYSFFETKIVHNEPRAFVSIMKGCNNFCTYCIVPFTRGKEMSRPFEEVVDDVRKLVNEQGIIEVTLLGQNINSYLPPSEVEKGSGRGEAFAKLVRKLEDIEGLKILRYVSAHPQDMCDDLIAFHGESKKLAPHLHLPVQSGSNSVLKRMARGYTIEHYLGLLEKLRKANPSLVISSDMICGFPNETEEEHEASLKLLDLAQFDFIYSYAYSPRPQTAALKMKDNLVDETRYKRLRELQLKQLTIQEKIREKLVGQRLVAIVEDRDTRKGTLKWKARTKCMRIVHFETPLETSINENKNYLWKWVEVEILSSTAISSQGKFIQELSPI